MRASDSAVLTGAVPDVALMPMVKAQCISVAVIYVATLFRYLKEKLT